MKRAAHFIMTVDRDTGRVMAVGIYSSSSITNMGGAENGGPTRVKWTEEASP